MFAKAGLCLRFRLTVEQSVDFEELKLKPSKSYAGRSTYQLIIVISKQSTGARIGEQHIFIDSFEEVNGLGFSPKRG
jgi:hypothetical protein